MSSPHQAPSSSGPSSREMHVDPRFRTAADRFFERFRSPADGGGAVAAYLHGEKVLDLWAGWRTRDEEWTHDTVTLCFSTGKGVASTVLHRLADRGLVDYDTPVAEYWPEFAAAGKQRITVRELMSHRAGLHNIREIAPTQEILLDTPRLAEALARATPDPRRYKGPGYHAVTYGNLVAEVASRASGKDFTTLLREEVTEPLDAPDMWFHVPEDSRVRIARVFPSVKPGPMPWSTTGRGMSRVPGLRAIAEAGMAEGFDELVRSPRAHDVVMPGWNGVFGAPSLARMYAALANGGVLDGQRYLSEDRVRQITQTQTRRRDYVLGIRPNWRLGYHPAWLRVEDFPRRSIGHYGFGGSGAWGDPETGLSFAFVSNRLGNRLQPVADGRMSAIGGAALTVAQSLARRSR